MWQIQPWLWQGGMVEGDHYQIPDVVTHVLVMAPWEPFSVSDAEVWHYPIDDTTEDLPDEWWAEIEAFIGRVPDDATVATFCHMGHNRSGLASVLLMVRRGIPVEEAVAALHRHRLEGNDPHLFWNPGFVRQVVRRYGRQEVD